MSETNGTTRYAFLDSLALRSLTPEEVGNHLGFTSDEARRRGKQGVIPGAWKIGGVWRFHAAPFEAWARGWWDGHGSFDDWLATQQPHVADC